MSCWRIAVECQHTDTDAWEAMLDGHCSALSLFENDEKQRRWLLEGYSEDKPDEALLRTQASLLLERSALAIEPLAAIDWVTENQKNFPPIRVGRFYIYGSHIKTPPPAASLPLKIDAATAFGTGEHATTQGCLLALQYIHKLRPRMPRMLDVGCGTGVLAMGAARLWPGMHAIGGDTHAPSIVTARANARDNRLQNIRYVTAAGTSHRRIQASAPYPLITANILAAPLCALAPALNAALTPGGWLVLSGLLDWQQRQVASAYRQQGLALHKAIMLGSWATLLMQKNS